MFRVPGWYDWWLFLNVSLFLDDLYDPTFQTGCQILVVVCLIFFFSREMVNVLVWVWVVWDSKGTLKYPPKTNMAMEHPPFEDVFPIENEDFPMSC